MKAFLLILSVFGIIYSIHPIRKKETDFPAYYLAGQRMIAKNFNQSLKDQTGIALKKDIEPTDSLYQWDPRPFRYAPVIAYIFMPFAAFPYLWGKTLWFVFNFLLLITSFILIYRHFKFSDDKKTFWFFILLFLIELRPISLDIKNLQVNFIILFCTVGFLYFRKGRENLAALLLALAVGFKIFPIFLLVFLLVEKEYRLLSKVIAAGAFLLILPILTYRLDLFNEYLTFFKFLNDGRNYPFPASANFAHPNLDSLVVRFLMDRPYHLEYKTNILSLAPMSVFYILLVLKITILSGIIFIHRHLKKLVKGDNRELYYWGIFGLYLNFSLIINPEAFKHGMVAMTIPWVAIGLLWLKNKKLILKEKVLLGVSLFLLVFTSHAIWGEFQRSILGRIGQDFWGIILMSVLLTLIIKRVLNNSIYQKTISNL